MTLQVVDINHRNIERTGETLGKAHAHEQRTHQTRTTGKGYCREVFLLDACTGYCLVNHRHHVLLVSAGSQLWNHAAVGTMHFLRGGNVAQQYSILEHCGRGIVAAALYT